MESLLKAKLLKRLASPTSLFYKAVYIEMSDIDEDHGLSQDDSLTLSLVLVIRLHYQHHLSLDPVSAAFLTCNPIIKNKTIKRLSLMAYNVIDCPPEHKSRL